MTASNPAIAKFAETNYMAFCERLEQMAADFEIVGNGDAAREYRVRAAIVWNAGRKELSDPTPEPVICGVCEQPSVCDWDVHAGRKRRAT